MPQRNVYKTYVADSYYHIFNRGVNKAPVFIDDKDHVVFLGLLKRYLGKDLSKKPNRELYPNYYDEVELLAFCLMSNHFHLFIHQSTQTAIEKLMRSVAVAYAMYFNDKYKRVGPVFQNRYKAVLITDDNQLLHITRYVHMNPDDYISFKWSSLPYYLGQKKATWVRPERVLRLFEAGDYVSFLDEYSSKRAELNELKWQLADA